MVTTHVSSYRQVRELYRFTQQELATVFGVSRGTVSLWESKTCAPPPAVQAAYRKLQEPMRTGDLHELERLRRTVLDTAAKAEEVAGRLNHAPTAPDWTELVLLGVGAVAIGLLLAALFSDD